MQEFTNQWHKDLFSKVMITCVTTLCIATGGFLISLFTNPPVFADDLTAALEPIKAQLAEQTEMNKQITSSMTMLMKAVNDNSIRYVEDQIIFLEVTASERPLTPTETQRLLRYKSDLAKIKK